MKNTLIIVTSLLFAFSTTALAKDESEKLDVRVTALEAAVTALNELTAVQQIEIGTLETELALANSAIAALQTHTDANEAEINLLQSSLSAAEGDIADIQSSPMSQLNPFVSVEYDELEGVFGPHILFEGANVHIRSGYGSTGDTLTGLGNLIIGYNEKLSITYPRTGSHNLVVGSRNGFSSYAGIVAGELNWISASYATITGGQWNEAHGHHSTVSGGNDNTSSGYGSSVSGGFSNKATGFSAAISGGNGNIATGDVSSVNGGMWNLASGNSSSVSGGQSRQALDEFDWVAGTLWEDN